MDDLDDIFSFGNHLTHCALLLLSCHWYVSPFLLSCDRPTASYMLAFTVFQVSPRHVASSPHHYHFLV